jgi:hypothetical protein
VLVGDIKNAYLYTPTSEKVWTTCHPEFAKVYINGVECNMSGMKALIVKALYRPKSSGRQWHKCLGDILRMGCDYKVETISGETRMTKNIGKLKH